MLLLCANMNPGSL